MRGNQVKPGRAGQLLRAIGRRHGFGSEVAGDRAHALGRGFSALGGAADLIFVPDQAFRGHHRLPLHVAREGRQIARRILGAESCTSTINCSATLTGQPLSRI